MPLVVAMSVKGKLIAEFFSTPLTLGSDMIDLDEIVVPKGEFTPSAFSLLFLKQFSERRLCQWVIFEPFGPVEQVSVKRACLAFYLDVALDGCRAMPSEGMPCCVLP